MAVSSGVKLLGPTTSAAAVVVLFYDDPSQIEFTADLLGREGLSILTVSEIDSAEDIIHEVLPDLVVSGAGTEAVNGAELCRRLKANSRTADIPVFLLSSIGGEDPRLLEWIKAGVDDVLETNTPRTLLKKRVRRLITGRRERKAVEARYRSLVESLPALVYVAEAEPPYSPIYISPNFESLGYSLDDWFKATDLWLRILHPDDRDRVLRETEAARAKGGENDYEYRVITANGSIRWFHDRGRFVLDSRARPVCWQGVIIDVTERRDAERALDESEVRFRSLVETASSAIILLSLDRRIVEWNKEAERIYGYCRQEVLGKDYFQLFHPPEEWDQAHRGFAAALGGYPIRNVEYVVRRRDGTASTLLWNATRSLDSEGRVAGLIAVGQDITERKLSEEALRASEQRYRDLFENANDIIYTRDLDGNVISVNKAAERLSGYTLEEIKNLKPEQMLSPETLKAIEATKSKVLQNGAAFPNEVEVVTVEAATKDGSKLTLEVSNRLIYQDGKPVAFQGIARDITERKNLQLQLAQTEKLSALGQLVSGVAHELNNPLTSVIGHVQLLLRSEVPRAFKDRLAIVGREGERARRIVQNLLSFARQHNPCRQEVDINALLDTTLELRAYDVATANITLEREYGRIPKTFADEHQLQQVFLNILINAEQSIGHDGGKGTIRIKTGVAPGPKHDGAPGGDSANRIVISITDDGPGISDEALGRVFDPFFTTKPVGMGTGLGLSITYGIIQEHKGTIKVESQPGHGACFTIELPVQVEF